MIDIVKFLDSHGIEYKGPNPRGYIVLNECVFCGKNKKLNISIKQDPLNNEIKPGLVKCYSCNSTGLHNLYSVVEKVDIEVAREACYGKKSQTDEIFVIEIERPDLETFEAESLSKILTKYQEIDLPDFSTPLTKDHAAAVQYLTKRGISFEDAKLANVHVLEMTKREEIENELKELGFSGEGLQERLNVASRFMGRVTFPVTFNNVIYGFVSRDYWGREVAYKVLNSSGPLTSAFVWNYDNAKKSARLVINEGIFDALKCGLNQSIALLGKASVEDSDRIKLIKKLNPDEIVIYLDNGAYDDAVKLAQILAKNFYNIKIVVTEPILNGKLEPKDVSFLSKLIPIEENEGNLRVLPKDLKLIKDFNRILTKSNSPNEVIKLMYDRIKLPDYKFNKSSQKLLRDWCFRFVKANSEIKNSVASSVSAMASLGYPDAGDRSFEENQILIEAAIPFNPSFNLSLIA